ncbi:MAG: flagellar biosynthetic protein FliO [Alphaproteobacteria bacterium]|nr:flagellar biosynthetic protein FliO [Alphaproteobacteria bacterium]
MAELQPYMNYILAGAAALVLVVLVIVLARLFSRRARGRKGMRLGIVEYCEIDQSRRLVLLRRDDVEHLVMIGGGQDFVVESRITTGLEDRIPAAPHSPTGMEAVVPIRPPRAPVFGTKRPPLRPVVPMPPELDDDQTPA